MAYEQPQNAFVAQFIGENNTLVGTVNSVDGERCEVSLDSGEQLHALPVNVAGVGSKTTLSLRPERVTINPAEGQCPNVVSAEVKELIYLGDHIRTRVDVCGHDDFIVKVPNSAGHKPMAEGEVVNVGWQVDDCRALDAPAA